MLAFLWRNLDWAVATYAFFTVVTFGHLYRHSNLRENWRC